MFMRFVKKYCYLLHCLTFRRIIARCSLRHITISMVTAVWILAIITSPFLLQIKLIPVGAKAQLLEQQQQQQKTQQRHFTKALKFSNDLQTEIINEQQKQQQQQQQQQQSKQMPHDLNQPERRVPPAMLPSETLRFRQRCWSLNYSMPGGAPVDHTPLPFLLGSSETNGPSCSGDIFLLVMVHSAVHHQSRRNLIRRTWASVTNIDGDRLVIIFFVGRSESPSKMAALRNESNSQADMVQGNFIDTYRNLTYKHLYALRWIGERCESVRYVMKVDDDVVLNLFQLRLALRERVDSVRGDFLYCQKSLVEPIRSPGYKWTVTMEEWPGDAYPEYCKGFGYVMTGGLVPQLHHCAKWRRYFWVDDVFVSGALPDALGTRLIQWEDGWGVKEMHPRLVGPEAAQLVIVYESGNLVSPTLHVRVWRAIMRHSGHFGSDAKEQ